MFYFIRDLLKSTHFPPQSASDLNTSQCFCVLSQDAWHLNGRSRFVGPLRRVTFDLRAVLVAAQRPSFRANHTPCSTQGFHSNLAGIQTFTKKTSQNIARQHKNAFYPS